MILNTFAAKVKFPLVPMGVVTQPPTNLLCTTIMKLINGYLIMNGYYVFFMQVSMNCIMQAIMHCILQEIMLFVM